MVLSQYYSILAIYSTTEVGQGEEKTPLEPLQYEKLHVFSWKCRNMCREEMKQYVCPETFAVLQKSLKWAGG